MHPALFRTSVSGILQQTTHQISFFYLSQKTGFDIFMQTASLRDNLHEMWKPIFLENKIKIKSIRLSSAEISPRSGKSWNALCGLRHAKKCLRACSESKDPDQTAHLRSLIRAFAVRKQNLWILKNVSMESKCPDETLRMCKMVWIRTFCACSKTLFRMT